MSQPIRISTGFGPTTTLQYIPKINTCIFPTKHTCMDVSYPEEKCRKRAWLSVSNRNPRPAPPFLLYATWKNEGSTGLNEDDELITMSTVRILGVLMDYDDLMKSLGVGRETLLGALQVWKERTSATSKDEVKYHSSELSKEVLAIVIILMDLNDPNDGFTVLNNALEVWNALLSTVDFNLNEEQKLPPYLLLTAFKFVLDKFCTHAEFRRVLSLILDYIGGATFDTDMLKPAATTPKKIDECHLNLDQLHLEILKLTNRAESAVIARNAVKLVLMDLKMKEQMKEEVKAAATTPKKEDATLNLDTLPLEILKLTNMAESAAIARHSLVLALMVLVKKQEMKDEMKDE